MWWLWVILGLIFGPMVIVGLILLIPIGLDIVYNVDGLEAWFYLGSYRTMLYPERKGNAFIQETGRKLVNKTTEVTTKAIKAVKEEGGGFNEFIPLLKIVLGFFADHPTEVFTRDAVADALGISPAQVTAACKALGESLTKSEAKFDKSRKVVYQYNG